MAHQDRKSVPSLYMHEGLPSTNLTRKRGVHYLTFGLKIIFTNNITCCFEFSIDHYSNALHIT